MKNYDLSKGFKKPNLAERLKKNGYTVQITEGENEKIVDEYFVSPEEVVAYDERRKSNRVQS